jgi:hypothetical protein
MSFARARALGLSILALSARAGWGCHVDDTLDSQLWSCDPARADECGTRDGRPMTCWEDFCMPSCDPNVPVKKPGQHCLVAPEASTGVLLDPCDPLGNDCPSTLHCLRTDVASAHEGLCVPMGVCTTNADCPGNVKTTCSAEVLREVLGANAAGLYTDHLLCVKDRCDKDGCPPGESCLPTYFALYAYMPAICVDNCDSHGQCAPGYACAQSGAPGAPNMCLPGVPGVRCTRDEDCMIGACIETGTDFKLCSITCVSDADCSLLDEGTYYRCVTGTADGSKHCINPTAFQGPDCSSDGMCVGEASVCFHDNPYERVSTNSECRVPCDENGQCPARGGLAHSCLGPEGGCFPGDFGIPCNDSSECMEPFTCEEISEEVGRDIVKQNRSDSSDASTSPLRICTFPCPDGLDGTCEVPATLGTGYCGSDDRCHSSAPPGSPCDRDQECVSANCEGNVCTDQTTGPSN